MSLNDTDEENPALQRAKKRLKRQIAYLALMLVAALFARHYVVLHLEESARGLARDEEQARAGATIELDGAVRR